MNGEDLLIKSFAKNFKMQSWPDSLPSQYINLNKALDGGLQPNAHYLFIGKINFLLKFIEKLFPVVKLTETTTHGDPNNNRIILRKNFAQYKKTIAGFRDFKSANNSIITFCITNNEIADTINLLLLTQGTTFNEVVGIYGKNTFYVLGHSKRWENLD